MRDLCLMLVMSALMLPSIAFDEPAPYKELVKSKPALINGLEFVAATQAQWLAFNPGRGEDPVEVQLWITNRTAKDLIFRVFDTFGILLKDTFGKEVKICGGGRDGCLRTTPVLIRPGETYCLSRKAVLAWHPDRTRTFGYEDGTGSVFNWGPLFAGKYTLSFTVSNNWEKDPGMEGFLRNNDLHETLPLCWKGKGTTEEVSFEVVDPLK